MKSRRRGATRLFPVSICGLEWLGGRARRDGAEAEEGGGRQEERRKEAGPGTCAADRALGSAFCTRICYAYSNSKLARNFFLYPIVF